MKNPFIKDPEHAVNYLKPATLKRFLITMGIKLILSAAGMFALPAGDYPGFAGVLLLLLFFAFIYDICTLYQACLHITQSVLLSFLLFLVAVFGIGIAFQYGSALFVGLSPSTASGEYIITSVMALIFLIPFFLDAVRLVRMLTASPSRPA